MTTTYDNLTEAEMIEDYYASLMDVKAYERLGVDECTKANRKIMALIDQEFRDRAVVPPWRTDKND